MSLERLVILPATLGARSFYSRRHPGAVTKRTAFGRPLVLPLATCLLPLMIFVLIRALEGYPILTIAALGFPLALACAVLWTAYRLTATVVEVHVLNGHASLRTAWEVLLPLRPLAWEPVLEVRSSATRLTLTLGNAAYDLAADAWPDVGALTDALREARLYDGASSDKRSLPS